MGMEEIRIGVYPLNDGFKTKIEGKSVQCMCDEMVYGSEVWVTYTSILL